MKDFQSDQGKCTVLFDDSTVENYKKEALDILYDFCEILEELPESTGDDMAIDKLQYYTRKIEELTFSLCFVGPAKSGKSTSINALLGLNIAPSETQPCTVLPTIFRHCPGLPHFHLTVCDEFVAIFNRAISEIRENADEIKSNCKNLSEGEVLVINEILMSKHPDIQSLEIFGDSEHHDIEGLKNRLSLFNIVCRIYARVEQSDCGDAIVGENPLTMLLAAGGHWPLVEMEMESLREKKIVGQFQIVDTPGVDETYLFPSIGKATTLALESCDAAVCVLSCTTPSPDGVDIVQNEVKLSREHNSQVYVLANRINDVDEKEDECNIIEAVSRGVLSGEYDAFKENIFGVDSKQVRSVTL